MHWMRRKINNIQKFLYCEHLQCFYVYYNHNFSILNTHTHTQTSSECFAQGQIFHCKRRNLGCSSAKRQVFHSTHRNQDCSFTRDWIGAVAYRFFSHPALYLAYEQTLKDLKRSQVTKVEIICFTVTMLQQSIKVSTGKRDLRLGKLSKSVGSFCIRCGLGWVLGGLRMPISSLAVSDKTLKNMIFLSRKYCNCTRS